MEPIIKITISTPTSKLSKHITESIAENKMYKYTYLKQLLTRLRIVEESLENEPEEVRILALGNTLITERNIAMYSAEHYAMLDQDDLSYSFMEIAEEIEELFK